MLGQSFDTETTGNPMEGDIVVKILFTAAALTVLSGVIAEAQDIGGRDGVQAMCDLS